MLHYRLRNLLLRNIVRLNHSSSFKPEFVPGPPKLPKKEQEEFEKLQKIANSQSAIDQYNNSLKDHPSNVQAVSEGRAFSEQRPPILKTDIGAFSPEYLKTVPEFEGEKNPETGEVGGPKQDPLRRSSEWTYNGRTIDF
ncbi:BA75_04392T0 [Komagataella pastoris]|uniref:Succinate dehydrogenase assembly factor 4, mitochondrial n=1 Tax=Komagataella pastoris TaxID=4922 RepID=A0A1B2JHP8_PICPA|nr:BA75_04392T0 [Komagataella pastoris]